MARYARGGSRRGSSRGGRGGSRYGSSSRSGSRSSRSRGGGRYDDDEYYDEEPSYYGKGASQSKHEQTGILIFGGALVVIIITIIFMAAGGGQKTIKKAVGLNSGGKYERDAKQMAASDLLGQARAFDAANPYEDKEIVADKYRVVYERYPGSEAAKEAMMYYDRVMDRRK